MQTVCQEAFYTTCTVVIGWQRRSDEGCSHEAATGIALRLAMHTAFKPLSMLDDTWLMRHSARFIVQNLNTLCVMLWEMVVLGNHNELKLKLIGLELIHIIDIYIGQITIDI